EDQGNQRDYDGTPMVTDVMHSETMLELARLLGERNEGFIQYGYPAATRSEEARKHVEELAAISRRPVIWNAIAPSPRTFELLTWLRDCTDRGIPVYGQGSTRDLPPDFTGSIADGFNQWDSGRGWLEATVGTTEEKLAKLADPTI